MRNRRNYGCFLAVATLLSGISACKMSDLSSAELPSGVQDPSFYNTPEGALGRYRAVIQQFEQAWLDAQRNTGMLTDELQQAHDGSGSQALDDRQLPEVEGSSDADNVYGELQAVRTYAIQANGSLYKYNPSASPALRGETFALAGYAEILLADLFCSGIPLSELEFEGEYQYKSGSTTAQVYQHAVTLFDSALALASDSARITFLAAIGKGRALLALDSVAAAAVTVHNVPDTYTFQFPGRLCGNTDCSAAESRDNLRELSVADREGLNGLPYRSSGDPRTTATLVQGIYPIGYFSPDKYGAPGAVATFVVASGIEGRLITAESELRSGNTTAWLATLNALRTTGAYTLTPNSADPGVMDTTWVAGSGGVPNLRPLDDPGTDSGRVSLLFAERAAWLFLTGTRQGDLRRLIRQYGRRQNQVYPIGRYPINAGFLQYGSDVTAPIPYKERQGNPLFTGCFNRGA